MKNRNSVQEVMTFWMKNRNFTQKSRILRDTPTGKPAAWSNTDIEFPMKFNILYVIGDEKPIYHIDWTVMKIHVFWDLEHIIYVNGVNTSRTYSGRQKYFVGHYRDSGRCARIYEEDGAKAAKIRRRKRQSKKNFVVSYILASWCLIFVAQRQRIWVFNCLQIASDTLWRRSQSGIKCVL